MYVLCSACGDNLRRLYHSPYPEVTMADKEGAERACATPNPVIEGRRANVNLAYIGAEPKLNGYPAGGCCPQVVS